MLRNHKTEEHKRLRRMLKEYDKLQSARRESGEWIDVEPYQRGWVRYFVLRDDAKNRKDAREMQQVLDIINTTEHSSNEEFLRRNWKTNKMEPIPQRPKHLNEAEYEKLTEKQKSFFVRREWIDKNPFFIKGYTQKRHIIGYVFEDEFYLVFRKEPNIVNQHWIPNQEVESLYGEMRTHFERNNVWAKLNKAMEWNQHNKIYREDNRYKYRNIAGFEFDDVE